MANGHTHELWKFIGSGSGNQKSYSIYVENGRIVYKAEDEGQAFMRQGDASSTRWISLDALKYNRVRGGDYYEAARAEMERQLQPMKEKDSETESRTPVTTTAEEVSLSNSSSPNHIPDVLPTLTFLEGLSLQDQGLFLLKRIVDGFGKVGRFWKGGLSWCMDGIDHFGLVPGLRNDEIRRGIDLLLDKPFDWIVRNGYFVARGPQRDHFYEITAKALAVVDGLTHDGLTPEADDSIDIIRSQAWYRMEFNS